MSESTVFTIPKVRTSTGKVHFGHGLKEGGRVWLRCQGHSANGDHDVEYQEPVTCGRCFTMAVFDLPHALCALGIYPWQYERIIADNFGELFLADAKNRIGKIPGAHEV